jgi:hypothetical protein
MPRKVKVIVVPPVNEFSRGISKFVQALAKVSQRSCGGCLINNPHSGMVEAKRNWMLVVDKEYRLRNLRLLQKTG